jgi:hypothetical protein
MISIQKIKLQELDHYVSSYAFKKLKHKPISFARVSSYLNNPRANKNDTVLYMAFSENELVAYRTILSDAFFIEKKKVSFGWLSGNWVHAKYRRKGFSTLLFNEALKDWGSKLMYTNYAVASKLVYDKTNQFNLLYALKGTKYFTRFCLADILPLKKKIFKSTKILWVVLDFFLNILLDFRNLFRSQIIENNYKIRVNENWEDSILKVSNNTGSQNLFLRKNKEISWIQNSPWVLTNTAAKTFSKGYYFSLYSKKFESNFYTIYNEDETLIGCLFMTVRDGHVKIPYMYCSKENSKEITSFLLNKCEKMKVKTIVIYNESIEEKLNNQLPFITKKAFTQKYFLTEKLDGFLNTRDGFEIQTGDGDVVFT